MLEQSDKKGKRRQQAKLANDERELDSMPESALRDGVNRDRQADKLLVLELLVKAQPMWWFRELSLFWCPDNARLAPDQAISNARQTGAVPGCYWKRRFSDDPSKGQSYPSLHQCLNSQMMPG